MTVLSWNDIFPQTRLLALLHLSQNECNTTLSLTIPQALCLSYVIPAGFETSWKKMLFLFWSLGYEDSFPFAYSFVLFFHHEAADEAAVVSFWSRPSSGSCIICLNKDAHRLILEISDESVDEKTSRCVKHWVTLCSMLQIVQSVQWKQTKGKRDVISGEIGSWISTDPFPPSPHLPYIVFSLCSLRKHRHVVSQGPAKYHNLF